VYKRPRGRDRGLNRGDEARRCVQGLSLRCVLDVYIAATLPETFGVLIGRGWTHRRARALVNRPVLVLGDEATVAVVSQTAAELMTLLQRLNRDEKVSIGILTHDLDFAASTDRTIPHRDGRVIEDERHPASARHGAGKTRLACRPV